MPAFSTLLRELDSLRVSYGRGMGERRLALLDALADAPLKTARQVHHLHELLCFLRAYPDSREVLLRVEELLGSFADRPDLALFRDELADSGIAGTDIYYRFYWVTACWLADHCPDRLTIDWVEFENREKLLDLLDLLLPFSESVALDMVYQTPEEWLRTLKRPDETDAVFLVRRFAALEASEPVRERIFEQLDVPLCVSPGPDAPSRTRAKHPVPRPVTQRRPLVTKRPNLRRVVPQLRSQTRSVWIQESRALIDRVREAMITRSRDLDAFAQADENDMRMVRFDGGLEFAVMGSVAEHRLLLETRYGILMLKNGVPIGYSLATTLFGSTEIAYNVFDTFRGAETALVFARLLALSKRLFGTDVVAIDPYQLGHDNSEGLSSGAWWFYYKLGFRPHDPEIKRLVKSELAELRRNRQHRSSRSTLQRLSADYMYLHLKKPRRDVIGRISLGNVGLAVSAYLAERFGADREKGIRVCALEAQKILGLKALTGFSAAERLAWERWSPLVRILPEIEEWTPKEKRALVGVIRAKGARRESDFVQRFDGHQRLRQAILELAGD